MTDKDAEEWAHLVAQLERQGFWEDIIYGIAVACFSILLIWGLV